MARWTADMEELANDIKDPAHETERQFENAMHSFGISG